MNTSFQIVAYDHHRHAPHVYPLWMQALAETWPITPALLGKAISAPMASQAAAHFIALDGPEVVGFIATQRNQRPNHAYSGNIGIVLVSQTHQRRGIGRALLDHALAVLREAGVTRVQLGGLYPRIWPGVPDNLPHAKAFFERCDWAFDPQIQYDLVGDVSAFQLPDGLRERMAAERLVLEPANSADSAAILQLQTENFNGWIETYRHVLNVGDAPDILVARDPDKGIVGSLIMSSPYSHPTRTETLWQTLLGDALGSMGEVGVAATERKRGIGLALVAYGAEVLKARGVQNCGIGWTSLVDFYGKLGFRIWQQYQVGRRTLGE